MSKIQTELCEALEISAKRVPAFDAAEERQEFLDKICDKVAALEDDEWNGLSEPAQDWYNEAADARNANAKTLPDFPDVPKAEKEEKTTTRRRSTAAPEKDAAPAVGDVVKLTTKRGKEYTGPIVELTKDEVVIKLGNGDEMEFNLERVESMITAASLTKGSKPAKEEDDGPAELPLAVGATVKVTTKRGKVVEGVVDELDDDTIVIGDDELARDKVESVQVLKAAKGEAVPEKEEKTTTRRGTSKDKGEAAGDDKKRASNPAGVSVGARIRELILDDMDITEEQVAKALKKEGIEFRENTLQLNYKDTMRFLALLKERKMLKA